MTARVTAVGPHLRALRARLASIRGGEVSDGTRGFHAALVAAGIIAAVVVLAPLYGALPLDTLLATGAVYSNLGFIECLAANATLTSCPTAGLPQGFISVFGLPMAVVASGFQRSLDLDVVSSYNLAGLLIMAISVPSMWMLLRMLGASAVWAFGGTLLFFSLPIVHANAGLGFLMWGFALFPVCLAATVVHWRLRRAVLTTALLVLIMTIQLFQEPYSFVMAAVFGVAYAASHVIHFRTQDRTQLAVRLAGWALAITVAVVLYKAYVPGGASYHVMSMDFFRAQGIDLVALLGRAPDLFAVDVPWGISNLVPIKFYTYGEAVRNSYLGLGLAVGIIVFVAVTRAWKSPQLMAVGLAACLGFILALGPSLKINSQRSETVDPQAGVSSYMMPPYAAVLGLPHAFVYGLPPANNMRAVNRWYLLFAVSAVAMAAVGLTRLSRHRRAGTVVAVALAVLIAVEYAPDYAGKAAAARSSRASFAQFNADAVGEVRGLLRPSERVIFLDGGPPNNDYLSLYLCAMAGCRTYNAVGDKGLELARAGWPEPIREALDPSASTEERTTRLVEVLQAGIADAVVLAHFDMRWDSYRWPPPPASVTTRSEELLSTYRVVPGTVIDEGTYFSVVRVS